MDHRVGIVWHPHAMLYEFAIAAEVFAVDRRDLSAGGGWYDVVVATPDGAPLPWRPDLRTVPYDELGGCDSLVLLATDDVTQPLASSLRDALRTAYAERTRVSALCTGAFLLAGAGLLDERRATTHWLHAAELARRYPRVTVEPSLLFVDEGDVATSAGKTAALDLCLHLVARDHGAAAANGLARRLVCAPQRPGGQAQFIEPPGRPQGTDHVSSALEWVRGRLGEPIGVDDIARRAGMSTRQLSRRMARTHGCTPGQWLADTRLFRAREQLEDSDDSVEQVAADCGFGTSTTLRRHFQGELGVTPTAYRRAFRGG